MTAAETIQASLTALNMTANIELLTSSNYWTPHVDFGSEMQDPQANGHLTFIGEISWPPTTLTPADGWLSLVSNKSADGNFAIYSNPTVQQCVNSFTQTTNTSYIKSVCTKAQGQVYDDAPYAWLGFTQLWYSSGSLVWQKGVIKSFLLDPTEGSDNTTPIFNTSFSRSYCGH